MPQMVIVGFALLKPTEDMKYWPSQSIAAKTAMVYSLWREHCWINREIFGLPGRDVNYRKKDRCLCHNAGKY